MKRVADPARAERERLLILERREKVRAEARAVADGVAETVRLSRARGAAFEKPPAAKAGRETAYRRMTGLAWLVKKGRLTTQQAQAGERYGLVYRAAAAEPAIGSTLEVQPGMSSGGPPLPALLKQAARREQAEQQLALYRRQLLDQGELVGVCDLVCGRELTPREAAGGERDAARLEAVLKVALDILAMAAR